MPISFISLKRNFKSFKENKLKKWISKTIISKNYTVGDINIIFCDDNYLLKLNINYLSHKTLTDIITFDYSNSKIISGDLYISIDRIKFNSKKFNSTFESELNRVIIHGILHLLGFKDKRQNESKLMKSQENKNLNKLRKY